MDREKKGWEIELEKRKMLQDGLITDMRKDRFITDITDGLGDKIIEEPNKIQEKPKKPSLLTKFKKLF